jgi:type II secretory pathway predicted ATPase ExeA
MNTEPFPFADYVRAQKHLEEALEHGDDTYLLLTGDTGTGKTALLRGLTQKLDRYRYRPIYFSHARQLGATGFVRVIARSLRLSPCRSHPETVQVLVAHLHEEPAEIWVWFDEAHELPEETLAEARTLAESDLGGHSRLHVLFTGLTVLRERLQAMAPLWRRIVVREELSGLTRDEFGTFVVHHFGKAIADRFSDDGLSLLFERGRGIPGLLLPAIRATLRHAASKGGKIQTTSVEDILSRWDLA